MLHLYVKGFVESHGYSILEETMRINKDDGNYDNDDDDDLPGREQRLKITKGETFRVVTS